MCIGAAHQPITEEQWILAFNKLVAAVGDKEEVIRKLKEGATEKQLLFLEERLKKV